MPENSQLKPSDVNIIATVSHEVSRLAILTVDLLAGGDVEEAKHCADLCKEGRDLIREMLSSVSTEERKTLAGELTKRYIAKQ